MELEKKRPPGSAAPARRGVYVCSRMNETGKQAASRGRSSAPFQTLRVQRVQRQVWSRRRKGRATLSRPRTQARFVGDAGAAPVRSPPGRAEGGPPGNAGGRQTPGAGQGRGRGANGVSLACRCPAVKRGDACPVLCQVQRDTVSRSECRVRGLMFC